MYDGINKDFKISTRYHDMVTEPILMMKSTLKRDKSDGGRSKRYSSVLSSHSENLTVP